MIGFTAGFLISLLIEGSFGWHAYLAARKDATTPRE